MSEEKRNFNELIGLFEQAHTGLQREAARAVNSALVVRNWLFGWYIVEFEQGGANRSELYGKKLLEKLAEELTQRLGSGYSQHTLNKFRQFYELYKNISPTVSAKSSVPFPLASGQTASDLLKPLSELTHFDSAGVSETASREFMLRDIAKTLSSQFPLSWSHYIFLMAVKAAEERAFYEKEAASESWSLRELKRQFNTGLYERLALSRDAAGVKKLSEQGQLVERPTDLIKNPYVLEFLGLDEREKYSESELENAIIDKLERFLLELGKGFLFEARQKRFTLDEDHYFVDLVFYNRLLRCYTLIDLKIGELTHQDLGQMQMYVNYYDRHVKLDAENPTVGIIICKKNKEALVEITLPQDSNIHASEYMLYLPSKDELKRQVEESLQSQDESE